MPFVCAEGVLFITLVTILSFLLHWWVDCLLLDLSSSFFDLLKCERKKTVQSVWKGSRVALNYVYNYSIM